MSVAQDKILEALSTDPDGALSILAVAHMLAIDERTTENAIQSLKRHKLIDRRVGRGPRGVPVFLYWRC